MQHVYPTTPFGQRSLTLAHVASQTLANSRPPEKAVHKWHVYRTICTAKAKLGVTERALTVLNALLTFHPETVLTGRGLVVFPSNEQLAHRAHGMSPSTLRRHLAVLVDAGLVVRRDSPNGKRYARKRGDGEIETAFGFDLSPLVVRAEVFDRLAEEVLAAERAIKLAREQITLCRRDVAKMIATGMEEGVPSRCEGRGYDSWEEAHEVFRGIITRLPRSAPLEELETIARELAVLADGIFNLLEGHVKDQNMAGNESQTERHIQNSKPDPFIDSEPSPAMQARPKVEPSTSRSRMPGSALPLGMILKACPDIVDYARGGISNWRDLMATAAVVRSMLGISPSAWSDAQAAMGELPAAVVVACMLQRAEAIRSAGGYLRGLTRKAEAGEFSLGPMLMALMSSHGRERRRA